MNSDNTFIVGGTIVLVAAITALTFTDCTSENVKACGIACDSTDQVMDRYSEKEGCVCKTK